MILFSCRVKQGVQVMVDFGVCYPLKSMQGGVPLFLFPSLCSTSCMYVKFNICGIKFIN